MDDVVTPQRSESSITLHKGGGRERDFLPYGLFMLSTWLRPTSHLRLRAHDHYTSSTLIGGKGETGPSSLHTYA